MYDQSRDANLIVVIEFTLMLDALPHLLDKNETTWNANFATHGDSVIDLIAMKYSVSRFPVSIRFLNLNRPDQSPWMRFWFGR
jgi:hypothetical protein